MTPQLFAGLERHKQLRYIKSVRKEPNIEYINKQVAEYFDIDPEKIRKKGQQGDMVEARQIAIWCIRQLTQLSLKAIGDYYAGRDHSTIIYSIQTVNNRIQTDYHYRTNMNNICLLLGI